MSERKRRKKKGRGVARAHLRSGLDQRVSVRRLSPGWCPRRWWGDLPRQTQLFHAQSPSRQSRRRPLHPQADPAPPPPPARSKCGRRGEHGRRQGCQQSSGVAATQEPPAAGESSGGTILNAWLRGRVPCAPTRGPGAGTTGEGVQREDVRRRDEDSVGEDLLPRHHRPVGRHCCSVPEAHSNSSPPSSPPSKSFGVKLCGNLCSVWQRDRCLEPPRRSDLRPLACCW